MLFLSPSHWKNYQLLDCGNYKKLERFGTIITSRPEPQAIWEPSLPDKEWENKANAIFKKEKSHDLAGERGEWLIKNNVDKNWNLPYIENNLNLNFRLGFSSFKHVGIFPEQASNWDFIFSQTKKLQSGNKKILNLFAYTGGASLAAKAAGGDVTHVDSVKQVISWAKENMELSGLKDIRWVVEDALKFVKREVKRGNKYHGIVLDPPAYGRGPDGEKWIIEEHLYELLVNCIQLLESEHFLVLNLYSLGYSSLIVETLMNTLFNEPTTLECGELFLQDTFHKKLPLGVFGRFFKN